MFKYSKLVCKAGGTLIKSHHKIKKYSKHPEMYSLEERYNYVRNFLIKINDKALHGYYIVNGLNNVPEGQVIFTPNHTSNDDPISMLITSNRPISLLAKKEILKMPYVRSVAKAIQCQFIDRYNLRSEIKTFKEAENLLNDNPNLSYVIFPEGTRSVGPNFNLGSFHPGSFKIAVKKQLPIVPVCIYLSARVLNIHYSYKSYPIQVTYLKPLMYEDYKDMTVNEISQYVHDAIEKELTIQKQNDPLLVEQLNEYSSLKTQKVLLRKTKHPKHPSAKKIEKNNKKYLKEEKKIKLKAEKKNEKVKEVKIVNVKEDKSFNNKLISTNKKSDIYLKKLEAVTSKNNQIKKEVNEKYDQIKERIDKKEIEYSNQLDQIYQNSKYN